MARPSRQASSDDKRMSYLLSQFSPPSTEMLSSDELTHAYDTKATRWLQQTSKSAAEALAAPTPVQPRPSLVIGAQKWSGAGSSSPSRAPVTSPPTLTSPSSPPSSLSSSSQSLSASLSSSSLPSAPSPSSSHPSSTGQSSSSSGASSDSSSLLLRRSPSSSLMSSRSHEDGLEIRMARALLLSENLTIMLPISEELTFAQLREQILTKARLRLTSSVDVSRWELAAQNADGLVFFPHPTSTPWHRFPIDELPAERGTAPCLDLLVGLPSDIAIFAAGWSQQKQQQQQASAVPAKSESSRRLFSQNLSAALRKSRTIRPPTIALPASTPQSLPMSRSPSPPRPSPSHHASQSPPSSQSSTSPTSTTTSTTTSALAAVSSQSVDSTGDMHQTVVSQIGMEGQLGRRRPRSTSLPLSTGVQQLFNPQQQFPKQLTRTVGFSFGRSSTESSPDASKTPPLPDAAMPVRTQSLASFAVDKLPPPSSSTPPPPPPAAATTKKTNKRASQRHSRRNSTGSLSQEDTSTTTSDDNNNDDNNNDADSNKSKAPYQFSMHDRLQFNSRTPIDLPRYETSKLEMELGGAYFLTDGEALDLLESPSSPTSLSPTSARHRPAVLAKAGDSEAHGKAAAKTPSRSQQSIRTFLKKRDTTRKDDDAISIDPLVVNAPHGSDLDLSAIRKIRKLAGHLGGSGSEVWSVSVAGWQCAMKIGQASVVGSSMLQEISMLAVLPPHPHIVRYLGHSLVGDTQLFLMELFDMQFEDYLNGLLAKQRDNQSSSSSSSGGCSVVPQRVAVRLAYECLRAIEHMHSHGIAHRDIKPANVFLRVDAASGLPYHAAIGDFDTATRFNYLVSPCGSPMFMAPEVIASKSSGKYTQLCDNYSLGMLIYVFVAGKLPFENIPLLKIPEAVLAKQRPKIPPFVLEDPVWAQLMDVSQQLSRFAANDRLPLAKAIKLVEPLYSTL